MQPIRKLLRYFGYIHQSEVIRVEDLGYNTAFPEHKKYAFSCEDEVTMTALLRFLQAPHPDMTIIDREEL